MASTGALPRGLVPVMLTPYTDSGDVDYPGVEGLVEWYIDSGAIALFAVAQSSEMFKLKPEERLTVATHVVKAANGRVPVVASGSFPPLGVGGKDIDVQAASVRAMHATGVSAVVLLASCLADQSEDEDQMKSNLEKVMELTPGIKLALYECPAPYHRRCSAEMVTFMARSGRFIFHKDTSRHCPLLSKKLTAINDAGLEPSNPFRFFNGNVTGLLHSLKEGGNGASVVCANFYPHIVAWLCANHDKATSAHSDLVQRVQMFLTVADALIKVKYPSSAKMYLKSQVGIDINTTSREGEPFPATDGADGEELMLRLQSLHKWQAEISSDCGIVPASAPVVKR
jgi:4-hydroxy-tetrahydrodipicolinate synthase